MICQCCFGRRNRFSGFWDNVDSLQFALRARCVYLQILQHMLVARLPCIEGPQIRKSGRCRRKDTRRPLSVRCLPESPAPRATLRCRPDCSCNTRTRSCQVPLLGCQQHGVGISAALYFSSCHDQHPARHSAHLCTLILHRRAANKADGSIAQPGGVPLARPSLICCLRCNSAESAQTGTP